MIHALRRRLHNWLAYGVWTRCQHRWQHHERRLVYSVLRRPDVYWTCPDCQGYTRVRRM